MSSRATAGERANPGVLPQPLFTICLALIVLGVVAFAGGLVRDPQTAWLAFHSNFIFFTMLACGGMALAAAYSLVSAEWPGPYRRFAESFAAFIPVAFVLGVHRLLRRRAPLRLAEERRHARQGRLAQQDPLLRDGSRPAGRDVDAGVPVHQGLGPPDAAQPGRARRRARRRRSPRAGPPAGAATKRSASLRRTARTSSPR